MLNRLLLISIIAVVLCSNCTREFDRPNLSEDPLITKYFSVAEIAELDKIIAFSDSCVMSIGNIREANPAYYHYIDQENSYAQETGDWFRAFDEEVKYNFLLNLDSNLINDIWHLGSPRSISNTDTILWFPEGLLCLDLRPNSRYMGMLNELGHKNEYFKEMRNSTKNIGGLSPSIAAGFFYNGHELNFDDTQSRLWASILLISFEESSQEKIDNYLKAVEN